MPRSATLAAAWISAIEDARPAAGLHRRARADAPRVVVRGAAARRHGRGTRAHRRGPDRALAGRGGSATRSTAVMPVRLAPGRRLRRVAGRARRWPGRVAAADYRIELGRRARRRGSPRGRVRAACAPRGSRASAGRAMATVAYDLRPLLITSRSMPDRRSVVRTRTRFHPELGTGRPEEVDRRARRPDGRPARGPGRSFASACCSTRTWPMPRTDSPVTPRLD